MVAGRGFEPPDLRVMSPTSYQAAPPRDILPSLKAPYYNIPKKSVCQTIFIKKLKHFYLSLEFLTLLCYNMNMNADFSFVLENNGVKRVAVAVSGGVDSMALLRYAKANEQKFNIEVLALNVEHGIRGESSVNDTAFVKDYCAKNAIPLITYEVNSKKYASEKKLSLEESARILRYECFDDAYNKNKFDYLLTAHHLSDNAETILFNLFRGASLNGLKGIPYKKGYVVRPLLNVTKDQIKAYVTSESIPFVVDETNEQLDYTRNYIRLELLPKIKEIFPESEKSLSRLSKIVAEENEFLDGLANKCLIQEEGVLKLATSTPPVLIKRATFIALKKLGLTKDWEKTHADSVLSLINKQNGASVNLPKNIVAIREYDYIVFSTNNQKQAEAVAFSLGEIDFNGEKLKIELVNNSLPPDELKNGLYLDLDKIPLGAVIRSKKEGDSFTKFGGGTKSLGDYLTDKKVAKRKRDFLPLVAYENKVLAIFSIAISDSVKVDNNTKNTIKITREEA